MKQNAVLKLDDKRIQLDEIEVTSRLLNIIFDMPLNRQLALLEELDSNGFNGSRRHERTCLKNPWVVMIDPEKDPQNSFIKDISRCGMFIETRRSFELGEKIVMKFQMPASNKIFKIVSEVVRRVDNGIGVKFRRQLS